MTLTKRASGKVYTVAELREFLADCDRLGVTGNTTVQGVAGIRGLKELAVKTGPDARRST